MKQTILTLAAAAVLFAACGTKQENNTNEEQTKNNITTMEFKNVNERVNMGAKLYVTPQPALMIATYDAEGNPDVMMAAWGGQYEGNQVCFQLSSHKTTDNLRLNKAFTLSFVDRNTLVQSDYFGLVSGKLVADKIARVGFTVISSPNVNAPIIKEYPLTLECKVRSFKDGILIGEVVNMSAEERILTGGKVDLDKLQPVVFDASANVYRAVGEAVGRAWQEGKVYLDNQ